MSHSTDYFSRDAEREIGANSKCDGDQPLANRGFIEDCVDAINIMRSHS